MYFCLSMCRFQSSAGPFTSSLCDAGPPSTILNRSFFPRLILHRFSLPPVLLRMISPILVGSLVDFLANTFSSRPFNPYFTVPCQHVNVYERILDGRTADTRRLRLTLSDPYLPTYPSTRWALLASQFYLFVPPCVLTHHSSLDNPTYLPALTLRKFALDP